MPRGFPFSDDQSELACLLLALASFQLGIDQFWVVVHDPRDEIFRALAARLGLNPKFEVLRTVVRLDAVFVMHVLERLKWSTED
jgi:hypothetical protein